MSLPALAALMLSLLAALLLAARPAPERSGMAGIVCGFAAGALMGAWLRPGPAVVALLAGLASAMSLLSGRRRVPGPVAAGLCAGIATMALLPDASGALMALFAFACVLAARRGTRRGRNFSTPGMLDQGQCAVVIAAPVIAALPGAAEGWRSALALAGAGTGAATPTGDIGAVGWWLALPLAAFGLGMLHQWWRGR